MAFLKKRIHLTVDDKTYSALEVLSNKRKQNLATVSLYLIQQSLELEEDMYFSKTADTILSKKQKRISHNKAWE